MHFFQNICNTLKFLFICLYAVFFYSCATTQKNQDKIVFQPVQNPLSIQENSSSTVELIFAGDIMAHTSNYTAGKFHRIWQDIKPILLKGDFVFANLEAPVNDKMPWNTFPQFNMHSDYVEAALDAGVNVFSLANNHTNDGYLEGIEATKQYFSKKINVWACGLKNKADDNITFQLLKKNDWKILFAAITEILNRPDYASKIDYYPPQKREELFAQLKSLTEKIEHDVFVLSIHTNEEEYKTAVTKDHRIFFAQLAKECGADIIWANHPHCMKEFEFIQYEKGDDKKQAFIMYGNGNTVSGQRSSPSLKKQPTSRDLTGDGLLISITMEKSYSGKNGNNLNKKITFKKVEPLFITSYIEPTGQITIKLADDDFIHSLERSGLYLWAAYIKSRKKLFEDLKGISKWQ